MEEKKEIKNQKSKKPLLVVRQTKTSMYRINKQNPLGLGLKKPNQLSKSHSAPIGSMNSLDKVNNPVAPTALKANGVTKKNKPTQSLSKPSTQLNKPSTSTHSVDSLKHSCSTVNSFSKYNKPTFLKPQSSSLLKQSVTNKASTQLKASGRKLPPSSSKVSQAIKPILKSRRSLSAEHFARKKHLAKPEAEKLVNQANLTQSLENLPISECSPIRKCVSFKTPIRNQRRCSTFHTPGQSKLSHSTPCPAAMEMQNRLNEWLKKRGKSVSAFQNLRCFSAHSVEEEVDEDKENAEPEGIIKSDSYELMKIESNDTASDRTLKTEVFDYELIVKVALQDIHNLLLEGYSISQCELWLANIRQKYNKIDEEPNYWECRAAIEQKRGNLTSTVECYKTAIIKGAEVKHVDKSLEQLLEKFSLLSIDASTEENKKKKHLKEIRNIFKSSIIQFAVQERSMKKKKDKDEHECKKYVATPVRRSTRISRKSHVSTPTVKLCNTLEDLDSTLKDSMCFQNNVFLK